MPAAAWAVPAAVGALGLYQGNKQANAARGAANSALKPQLAAQQGLLGLAQNYNAHESDKQAIAGANQNATAVFGQSLKNLQGDFLTSGGQPTGDTAFNVNATNAGNRAIDPLKAFAAQLSSTESRREADMYSRVFGAPVGQIANTYFDQAAQAQGNMGNSLAFFIDGLKKIPWSTMGGVPWMGATPSGVNPSTTMGQPGDPWRQDGSFGVS